MRLFLVTSVPLKRWAVIRIRVFRSTALYFRSLKLKQFVVWEPPALLVSSVCFIDTLNPSRSKNLNGTYIWFLVLWRVCPLGGLTLICSTTNPLSWDWYGISWQVEPKPASVFWCAACHRIIFASRGSSYGQRGVRLLCCQQLAACCGLLSACTKCELMRQCCRDVKRLITGSISTAPRWILFPLFSSRRHLWR